MNADMDIFCRRFQDMVIVYHTLYEKKTL
jgi:hypothetical protein